MVGIITQGLEADTQNHFEYLRFAVTRCEEYCGVALRYPTAFLNDNRSKCPQGFQLAVGNRLVISDCLDDVSRNFFDNFDNPMCSNSNKNIN